MSFFASLCNFYLIQGICRHAVLSHAYCYAPSPTITTSMQLPWAKAYTKTPTLVHLLPPTHASAASQSRPVWWSADLKRKMRSWWGAEGLAQRRPVEGCRAEKILCGTNKKHKKETWKRRKERKREEKNNNYWVNKEIRSKTCTHSS